MLQKFDNSDKRPISKYKKHQLYFSAPLSSLESIQISDLSRIVNVNNKESRHSGLNNAIAAPLQNNRSHLDKYSQNDSELTKITTRRAREIWFKSCLENHNKFAYFSELYPHLIDEFKLRSECENRNPTLKEIEYFFCKCGGKYAGEYNHFGIDFENKPIMFIHKFQNFWDWFVCMCNIVKEKDLKKLYDTSELNKLDALFKGRNSVCDILEGTPNGTFILRLGRKVDCLALTYKRTQKIKHILLKRIEPGIFEVGQTKKRTSLYKLIRPWITLKYLYANDKLYRKENIF